jgi:ketosteroid isomerase-like protein
MRSIVSAAFAVVVVAAPALAAAPAAASDSKDAWDNVDMATVLGDCAAPAFIIDDFPPHLWQGATACADWARDEAAFSQQNGITDAVVTLGSPLHVDVTGDRAYVVVPATYAYKQKGKKKIERDAVWTVALQKTADGWRVAGWSWAQR